MSGGNDETGQTQQLETKANTYRTAVRCACRRRRERKTKANGTNRQDQDEPRHREFRPIRAGVAEDAQSDRSSLLQPRSRPSLLRSIRRVGPKTHVPFRPLRCASFVDAYAPFDGQRATPPTSPELQDRATEGAPCRPASPWASRPPLCLSSASTALAACARPGPRRALASGPSARHSRPRRHPAAKTQHGRGHQPCRREAPAPGRRAARAASPPSPTPLLLRRAGASPGGIGTCAPAGTRAPPASRALSASPKSSIDSSRPPGRRTHVVLGAEVGRERGAHELAAQVGGRREVGLRRTR